MAATAATAAMAAKQSDGVNEGVSDSGQNFRHNVNVGGVTLQDGTLNNGAVPPVTVTGIASSAYTNNDDAVANPAATSTGTVLFNINAASGMLVLQIPPNSGGTPSARIPTSSAPASIASTNAPPTTFP